MALARGRSVRRRAVSVAVTGGAAAVAVVVATGLLPAYASVDSTPFGPGGSAGAAVGSSSSSAHPVHGTGALLSGPPVAPHLSAASARAATALPASVDLSQWAMPVGDQGSAGSCVPWAVNYNLMGWYANKSGQSFAGAPMYVYSQDHIDNSFDGGGSYVDDAFNIAATQGVDTQAHYTQGNYNFEDLPTASEIASAKHHLGLAEQLLFYAPTGGPGVAGMTAIKTQLAAGHPVVITFPDYLAFDNLDADDWTIDSADVDTSTFRGDHAVTILGYDASGVRVENQWGTTWGQHGWANMTWSFVEKWVESGSTMTGIVSSGTSSPALPGAVSGVAAVANSTKTAIVSWQPPAPMAGMAITGYRISTDVGGLSVKAAATATSISLNLEPGVTYHIGVRSLSAAGSSPATTVVLAMPKALTAPKGLKVVKASATTAKVSWTPPAANGQVVTGYIVSSTAGGGWSHLVGPGVRSLVVTLKAKVSYPISVQAVTATQTGVAAKQTIKL